MRLLRRVEDDFCGGIWTRYSVTGPRGAVNLTFSEGSSITGQPWGVDFGYHSPRPFYEGQYTEDHCELLGEVRCHYDGSGLRADQYLHLFTAGDTEAIFEVLEAEYAELFGAVHV